MDRLTVEEVQIYAEGKRICLKESSMRLAQQLAESMRELQYYKELAHNLSTGTIQPHANLQAPLPYSDILACNKHSNMPKDSQFQMPEPISPDDYYQSKHSEGFDYKATILGTGEKVTLHYPPKTS